MKEVPTETNLGLAEHLEAKSSALVPWEWLSLRHPGNLLSSTAPSASGGTSRAKIQP